MKNLYIAEKPSVANEFAKALKLNTKKKQGFLEADNAVVTWCVGHLVTMSYPESYGEQYKRWSLDTLPFLPKVFKYEVIDAVKEQYKIVSGLLNREDIACIYICTDSGREGEYIYRLVDNMAKVNKPRKRVWIDSQTEEEILRGIKEAKDWSFYDNLAASAYLRAKEDYLMGINFSRLLTLKYSKTLATLLKKDRVVLSVGRVMTCVVGMVVRREREIRDFKKTVFYKIIVKLAFENKDNFIEGEFRAVEESKYYNSPKLYKDNGFLQKEDADKFILELKPYDKATVIEAKKKKEFKNPPLLYNLAELQNDCSKKFKISPDETLKIAQKLYERKLLTYPRTDARVLSKAVAKNIVIYREENGSFKNRKELLKVPKLGPKAYEQCAGFLRIYSGDESLDITGVHPESYKAAKQLIELLNFDIADISSGGIKNIQSKVEDYKSLSEEIGVGEPTLRDIVKELEKPARDPRDEMPKPILRTDVLDINDIKEGMILKGTVRNVIDFGVFVDIGVHQDGLVHISQLSKAYIKHPLDVVSVGDIVEVKVLSVDTKKNRIALSMIL